MNNSTQDISSDQSYSKYSGESNFSSGETSESTDYSIKRSSSFSLESMFPMHRDVKFGTTFEDPNESDIQRLQKRFENKASSHIVRKLRNLDPDDGIEGDLLEATALLKQGMQSVVSDNFMEIMREKETDHWNYVWYLFIFWLIGVVFRYLVLFPIRFIIFVFCMLSSAMFAFISLLITNKKWKNKLLRFTVRYYSHLMILSWFGVIKYHGNIPKDLTNSIIVSNHTSPIDALLIFNKQLCSVVGQNHAGVFGFIQHRILHVLEPIWFERRAKKNQDSVVDRIKKHLKTSTLPMLIFPEGTCINNEYCVMFKKGAFETGAKIIPVAIKYNKIFVDGFWNSKKDLFVVYLIKLMCCWALVVDIYFLDPITIRENETPIQFANRTKKKIAKKAKLKNVNWDGYLKHVHLSSRFIDKTRKFMAEYIKEKFQLDNTKIPKKDIVEIQDSEDAGDGKKKRKKTFSQQIEILKNTHSRKLKEDPKKEK
ncbi:acyltransferase-like [Anaeramoeba flamelloides]|uniref:Acyltransferase-like n=1 Tax=Anaeramoeba flamelloides TaxID=1746091 RepID=A0AAV8AE52_9EUKA|nr:acyltransferase-like [Anaeramoeba flamelloides]